MRGIYLYWLLIVSIIFFLVILGVGMVAPKTFRRQAERVFPYSTQTVWNVLSQYKILANRKPETLRVEYMGTGEKGGAHWKEYTQRGHTAEFEMVDLVPNESITIRLVRSPFSTSGQWKYSIASESPGCKVKVEETIVVDSVFVRGLVCLMGSRFSNLKQELANLEKLMTQ